MSGGANPSEMRGDPGEGGFALIIVLLFLLTVTALIAPLVLGARTQFVVSANRLQQDRLEMISEGILSAISRELAAPPIEARSPGLTTRSAPLRCRAGNLIFEARVQDQRGAIGLNTAPQELIEAGFVALDFGRTQALELAKAVVAFRMTPEAEGERPDVEEGLVTGGLKNGPFEAVEELYDFSPARRVSSRAFTETFTTYNDAPSILGPAMSERLSRILPAAPTPRYPFIAEEADEGPKTYRIEILSGMAGTGARGFAGAIVRASGDEAGQFEYIERITNPDFLPEDETDFSGTGDCDRLFGVGVTAFLATVPG